MNSLTARDLEAAGLRVLDLTAHGTRNTPRKQAPKGAMFHTTGSPFVARVLQKLRAVDKTPSAEDLDIECATDFDRRPLQGGYQVGLTGLVTLLERDDRQTSHAGMLASGHPNGNIYRYLAWRDWAKPMGTDRYVPHGRVGGDVYDWWFEAVAPLGIETPLDLPSGRYPNRTMVGVDLIPHPMTGTYTSVQLRAAAVLLDLLSACHGFTLAFPYAATHSLGDPLGRGTVKRSGGIIGVHWDPGRPFELSALVQMAADHRSGAWRMQ